MAIELIVIGTSAGGVTAIQKLLSNMSAQLEIPIVIVQHLPSNAVLDLNLIFKPRSGAKVFEALDKMKIEKSSVYFAPPNYHLLVERNMTLSLSQEDPVHFSRPSIDVLFESAANSLESKVCGILLTGANDDGASGLKFLHHCGGLSIVQNPLDAEVPAMPQAALNLFRPTFIGSIKEIAGRLSNSM